MIVAFLYVFLFVLLMPVLIKAMEEGWGRIVYGVLAAIGLLLAFRLRFLFRKFQ